MIGKIARSGSDFLGVLTYCQYDRKPQAALSERPQRGELIYHQHIDAFLIEDNPDLDTVAAELHRVASLNSRTRKPVCHVSLSFPPGEKPPRDVLASIVLDFAQDFGLWDNGLVAYVHRDKRHEHLHIIANKIDENGKNTFKSSFNYLDMGHFCRKAEHKYGLQKVKQMDVLKLDGKENRKESHQHEHLRALIDDLLPQSPTLQDLRIGLLKKGYRSLVGNGITFIHTGSGVKIKGSDLGRGYSRLNLEKRIKGTFESDEKRNGRSVKLSEVQKLRELIRRLVPQSTDYDDFVIKLNQEGYGVITRQKRNPKTGNPYTALFFTKEFSYREPDQSKYPPKILSGYQLGPEFSFPVLMRNLNRPLWEGTKVVPPVVVSHPSPLPGTPPSFGLKNLLTSTNASRVEADTTRSQPRRVHDANRPDPELEGRSEQEKWDEKRQTLKNRYRRPRM